MVLVLDRKIREKVLIGDNVVVTVLFVGRSSVRLGIEAPANIRIMREEVLEKEQDAK